MISLKNYEEYMVLHADGELQPVEERELIAFLDTHPELKSEMIAYDLARFSPDENIVYTAKDTLLKSEPSTRTITFPQWRRYAIAAGIATLMCISFFTYREMNKNTMEIVKGDTGKTSLPVSINDTQIQNQPKPQQEPQNIALAPVHSTKSHPAIRQATYAIAAHNKRSIVTKPQDGALVNNTTSTAKTTNEISSLSTTHPKPLPSNIAQTSPPLAIVPSYEISIPDKPAKRSFIDRLPIDEANKRQLKTIAHITLGASRGVSKVKEELDGNAITLNINNANVHISL